MTKLTWNAPGERVYQAGVDCGVLYVGDAAGVPWNGLINVTEAPVGGEATPYYLEGMKYLNKTSKEEFAASIEAYTYPDEFAACDGTAFDDNGIGYTQQLRKTFGLSYRTLIGNDTNGVNHGYQIHLIYNAVANPTSVENTTLSDAQEATTFTWDITTTPISIVGFLPTAHLIFDSRKIGDLTMVKLEDLLYGSDDLTSKLPTQEDIRALFSDTEPYPSLSTHPSSGLYPGGS